MKPETRWFYQAAVQGAVARVVNGLDEALDLERLARAAALSPFHFHRIFRGMVGETPLELHRRLRMERAARALIETDTGITTVALNAGYDSHEAFTRSFRSAYGCTPSEFRQQARNVREGCARPPQVELASRSGIHHRDRGQPALSEASAGTASDPTTDPTFTLLTGDGTMNVEIKTMPAMRVASLQHVGPYNRISEAFARLGELAGRAGLIRGKPTMLAIYHDDPEITPEAELRSNAALVIAEGVPIPPGLHELQVAAGRYASTLHRGPYETLGDSWSQLMGQWLPQSGQRIGPGVSYEIYRNTPLEVPRERLETELYVPLV
ncbi:MAG TPA: AraC family transcriptional regulator [Polyangia bacterium]